MATPPPPRIPPPTGGNNTDGDRNTVVDERKTRQQQQPAHKQNGDPKLVDAETVGQGPREEDTRAPVEAQVGRQTLSC